MYIRLGVRHRTASLHWPLELSITQHTMRRLAVVLSILFQTVYLRYMLYATDDEPCEQPSHIKAALLSRLSVVSWDTTSQWRLRWWCVLQLFRAPRGRIQPLSQMGQDLQSHDRKWLEGLPRKQGTRSLETMTETNSFRNGNRTRDLWKSTRVLLPSLAV